MNTLWMPICLMAPFKFNKNVFLKNKAFLIMLYYMVSKATHYAVLKNGCTYKNTHNTHISAVTHHRILNLVPNYFVDTALVLAGGYTNYLLSIFMNINEIIRNERKGCTYKITNISAANYH